MRKIVFLTRLCWAIWLLFALFLQTGMMFLQPRRQNCLQGWAKRKVQCCSASQTVQLCGRGGVDFCTLLLGMVPDGKWSSSSMVRVVLLPGLCCCMGAADIDGRLVTWMDRIAESKCWMEKGASCPFHAYLCVENRNTHFPTPLVSVAEECGA